MIARARAVDTITRPSPRRSRLAALALAGALALLLTSPASARPRKKPPAKPAPALTFDDPAGDDHGPGGYVYPTDAAFTEGAFDLRKVTIDAGRRDVTVRLTFAAPITDPWFSKTWGGPGFSLQLVHVYLATDKVAPPRKGKKPKKPAGYDVALPGIHARFAADARWDRAVLVSAEEPRTVARRVKALDGFAKGAILVPEKKQIAVDGDTIVVTLPRRAFGKLDPKAWGVQVVVGSTDFYAGEDLLLARLVNAHPGAFRFGGGHDGLCDPNVVDLLDSRAAMQHSQLGWKCGVNGDGMATLSLMRKE